MIEMGIEPRLCLCYGNELYPEEAGKYFGAVGCPPIKTEAERKAWDAYVTETYNGETSFALNAKNLDDKVQLIDMLDGSIYDCNGRYEVKDGKYIFTNMPLTDSPLLITIGNFIK